MDILKTLITFIPTSGMPIKIAFFMVGVTLLAWYTFGYVPAEHRKIIQSKKKIEAVSWYLGWNTLALLVPDWPKSSQVMPSMDAYLEVMDVSLDKPSDYYLSDPENDGGSRVQIYREQVYSKIMAKHSRSIAQYYGVASNFLQTAGPIQRGPIPDEIRAELQKTVNEIELPENLSTVPEQDFLDWLNSVNEYFESRL